MYYKNRGSTRIILAGGGLLSLLIVVVIIASMGGESAQQAGKTKQDVEKKIEEQIQKPMDAYGRTISKMTEGSFDVILEDIGEQKNAVIEAVGALKQIDPREAETLLESAPAAVLTGLTKVEAENAKRQLEQAGATARIDKHKD